MHALYRSAALLSAVAAQQLSVGPGAARRQQQPQRRPRRRQPAAPAGPAACRDLPRRGQLRRDRRHRHRRAGQLRPQPDQGGLRGRRGRQAAGSSPCCRSSTSRSSGRTRRSSRRPRSSRTCAATTRSSTAACSCSCSTTSRPSSRRSVRVQAAAKQFIERYLGANDIAAIVQTGGAQGRRAGVHEQPPAAPAGGQHFAGPEDPLRHARQDRRLLHAARTSIPARRRATLSEAERAFKARNTLSTLRQVADYLAGVRGRRKAVVYFSEGIDYDIDNPIQNRYATDIRDEMQAGDCRGDARQRQLLRHRPARPDDGLGDEGDRDHRRFPTIRRSASARRRSATSCGGRRTACGRSRKRRAASPPSTATTSARPSPGSSRTTAATTCSATTRPTPGATAGSGACRSASSGRA